MSVPTNADIAELARAAGAAGRSWMDWTASDVADARERTVAAAVRWYHSTNEAELAAAVRELEELLTQSVADLGSPG